MDGNVFVKTSHDGTPVRIFTEEYLDPFKTAQLSIAECRKGIHFCYEDFAEGNASFKNPV